MPRNLRTLFLTAALTTAAFACGNGIGRSAGPAAAFADAPAAPQLYELRVYTAAPGKMDALHARFRDHTLRLFDKHRIRNVGYWTGVDGELREKLYYLVAYPDREAREQRLVNGIAKDPEFLRAVTESVKDGKLTAAVESVLLTPTDYSPIR